MQGRKQFASLLVTVLTLMLAGFAAPSAPASSVRGSYRSDFVFWGYEIHERRTLDARIVNGLPEGTLVIDGWSRLIGGWHRYYYEYHFDVVSVEIAGNEAWVVAQPVDNNRGDWVAHIVDNGSHDLVNGYEVDGSFRVRE